MTDADTLRVPDEPEFRWHPDHGMFREHCGYWHHVLNRQGWGPAATTPEELATMPADAVKLGDVGAARVALARALRLNEDLPMGYLIEQARGVWDHAAEFFAGRAEMRNERDKALAELDKLRADIRAVLDEERRKANTTEVPDELDELLGIDPNDPIYRWARLFNGVRRILDREPGREEEK